MAGRARRNKKFRLPKDFRELDAPSRSDAWHRAAAHLMGMNKTDLAAMGRHGGPVGQAAIEELDRRERDPDGKKRGLYARKNVGRRDAIRSYAIMDDDYNVFGSPGKTRYASWLSDPEYSYKQFYRENPKKVRGQARKGQERIGSSHRHDYWAVSAKLGDARQAHRHFSLIAGELTARERKEKKKLSAQITRYEKKLKTLKKTPHSSTPLMHAYAGVRLIVSARKGSPIQAPLKALIRNYGAETVDKAATQLSHSGNLTDSQLERLDGFDAVDFWAVKNPRRWGSRHRTLRQRRGSTDGDTRPIRHWSVAVYLPDSGETIHLTFNTTTDARAKFMADGHMSANYPGLRYHILSVKSGSDFSSLDGIVTKKNRGKAPGARKAKLKKVSDKWGMTPRKKAVGISAVGVFNKWPIGDKEHARLALVYALSPSHKSKRRQVLTAVASHYPQYDWAAWWNKKQRGKAGVKTWGHYVSGAVRHAKRNFWRSKPVDPATVTITVNYEIWEQDARGQAYPKRGSKSFAGAAALKTWYKGALSHPRVDGIRIKSASGVSLAEVANILGVRQGALNNPPVVMYYWGDPETTSIFILDTHPNFKREFKELKKKMAADHGPPRFLYLPALNPRREASRRRPAMLLPVPEHLKATKRPAACDISAVGWPESRCNESGYFPIGDLYHARKAINYVMSRSFPKKTRDKVFMSVVEHYRRYDWAIYWDEKSQERKAKKGRGKARRGRRAAANPTGLKLGKAYYDQLPTNAGPYLPDIFPYGQGGRPATYKRNN